MDCLVMSNYSYCFNQNFQILIIFQKYCYYCYFIQMHLIRKQAFINSSKNYFTMAWRMNYYSIIQMATIMYFTIIIEVIKIKFTLVNLDFIILLA